MAGSTSERLLLFLFKKHMGTHLSLTDISTLFADNAVDNSSMVEAVDEWTAACAHKRVLQSTEQDPVELLHVMLICPLKRAKTKTNDTFDGHENE